MNIPPLSIDQDGPGIDFSSQPEGFAIQMADPVPDLSYSRNAVTMVFDLTGVENAGLAFDAMEFGDESHGRSIALYRTDPLRTRRMPMT